MILKYIKLIFSKIYGKLSLVATISGLILFYTNFDTRNEIIDFISNNLFYLSILLLIISSYQVWKDIQTKNEELIESLKNPIDYEIKAYIKK